MSAAFDASTAVEGPLPLPESLSGYRAMSRGFRLVLGAPSILLLLWLLNAALAAAPAWFLLQSLSASFGKSRIEERLTTGFDVEWWGEYRARADGIERTFDPSLTGAGAFYTNLDRWLSGQIFRQPPQLLALGAGFALLWLFSLGGALDRYAGRGSRGPRRFVQGARQHFFRFVRLALLSAPLYYLIYRWARDLLRSVQDATRDVTVEGTVLYYHLLAAGLIALALTLVHMVFGYAKIVTVVEQRRSAVVAALRAAGFVLLHPVRTLGLYYGFLALSVTLLALYAFVAPGATQSTRAGVAWAFAGGQAFLLARLVLRLSLLAAETALYRSIRGDRHPVTVDPSPGQGAPRVASPETGIPLSPMP